MKRAKLNTTIGDGCPVTVDFELHPGQRLIMNPIEKAQEGIPPEIVINTITVEAYGEDWEILDDLSEKAIARIEEECWGVV